MDYKIQLISLIFSFFYGIFFYITGYFNYNLLKKSNLVLQYIISFFYALDVALLYILLMYKINYGVIHIYFVGILVIGYIFGIVNVKKLRKKCQVIKAKLKK